MINIAELLKDASRDLELYSPICGHCKLSCILYDDGIRVIAHDVPFRFDKYGRFCSADDAECLLFPSKGRTWEGWKLPVEPKFKVGDWVESPNSSQYLIAYIDKEDNRYLFEIDESTGEPMHYEDVQVVNSQYHLWTIADVKDGDIIGFNDCTHNDGSYIDWVGIYKQASETNQHLFHCVIPSCRSFRVGGLWRVFTAYPATKEQRDLLFKKMKEAGYQWDAEKKELRKIHPHYDIANFYAGMPVLARGAIDERWTYVLFSHSYVGSDGKTHFNAGGWIWNQCIPFIEDTKHLLGTTDMCDERFINW